MYLCSCQKPLENIFDNYNQRDLSFIVFYGLSTEILPELSTFQTGDEAYLNLIQDLKKKYVKAESYICLNHKPLKRKKLLFSCLISYDMSISVDMQCLF